MKSGSPPLSLLCLAMALAFTGCGHPSPRTSAVNHTNGFPGMEADLQHTLKTHPDMYVFKTQADWAKDTAALKWEDGSDLPEFADPNAKRGGTLRIEIPDFPATFRTVGPDSVSTIRQYLLDYNELSLISNHPNLPDRYIPGLAESWAVDRPHKTVYFKLDADARWSDGAPVTTDDVVFTFYMCQSRYLDDPFTNDFFSKTYQSLVVYDAHDFAIVLKEVHPDMEYRTGGNTLFPKHFFADFGPHWEQRYDWRVTPTTGPYTVKPEDIKRQVSITLSRVPNWWGSNKRFQRYRYNPEKIRLEVIHDQNKSLETFLRGDLDMTGDNQLEDPGTWYNKLPMSAPTLAGGYAIKTTFYNQRPCPDWALWINESQPILNNRNVRLGIQYATDFDLVCKEYFRGDAVREQTSSDGFGWNMNPSVHARPFDPLKARSYFAKAGFDRQGPDGILINASGRRLSFTITPTHPRYENLLLILKQEAVKAGLEFNIELLDETTAFKKIDEKRHEIAFAAFDIPPEEYPRYWDFWSSQTAYDVPFLPDGAPNPRRKPKSNTENLTCTANHELDKLITAYDKAETMEQVKLLAAKIEQIIYDDAAWVNGWKQPFYRLAYGRWIKWPAGFNVKQSMDEEEFWLMWIDQNEEKETQEARAAGRTFPPQNLIFDQYKER